MKSILIFTCIILLAGCGRGGHQNSQAPLPPSVHLGISGLSFTGISCGSNPASQTFEITNAGEGTLTWSVSNLPSWLLLTPSSGTAPTAVTAQIDTTGLSCGQSYSQTIHVEASGAGNTPVDLTVSVTIPPLPVIGTDPSKITFVALTCGGIATSSSPSFTIGGAENSFNWSAAANSSWIHFAPTSGTAGATVTLENIDTSTLPCGATSSGTITISSDNTGVSPASITVDVVVPPRPAIVTSTLKVSFTAATCGGSATSGSPSFTITSDGNGSFNWNGTANKPWIQFAPTHGTDGATVTVANIDTSTLPCGVISSGTITLTSVEAGNSPQSITVEVTTPPAATINPSASALGFFATGCKVSPDPQPFTIQNNGGSLLGWSAAVTYTGPASGWVSLDITSGTVAAGATSAPITVTPDASGLTCGLGHSATITLTATSGGSNASPVLSKTIEVGLSNPMAWAHQNPRPTSYPMNDVTFSEPGVAWAVGDGGTLFRSPPDSPDYGNNWISVVSGTGANLHGIYFVSALEGWVVGDSGTILHSTDGGATWTVDTTSPTSQPLQSVFFLDASHGWAVGNAGTVLYRDSSATWTATAASGSKPGQFTHIFMNDATHGWITVSNPNESLLWTNDNWSTAIPQDQKNAAELYSVFFLPKDPNSAFPNRLEGWAVGTPDKVSGHGSILHIYSDTGVEPWTTEVVDSGTTYTLLNLFMSSSSLGWAVGGDESGSNPGPPAGIILRWDGFAWSPVTFNTSDTTLPSPREFKAVASSDGNGVAAGFSGMVFTSFNGTEWDNVSGPSMNDLTSIGFALDGINGWAVGKAGTVLTTSNGGMSWVKDSPAVGNFTGNFTGLSVVGATNAWAVNDTRQIYHYSSGSWGLQTTLAGSGNLKGVYFADAANGWAVGKITNLAVVKQVYYYNGTSWSSQSTACLPTTVTMNGVYFFDASYGWMVGTSGWTAYTIDGGTNWNCVQVSSSITFNSVHFISVTTGWAVGSAAGSNSAKIYNTINGGMTWSPQTSWTSSTLSAVHFADATHGWAVGAAGVVVSTLNGGSNWTQQSSVGTNQSLTGLYFAPNGLEGWAVGANGVILHTVSGGTN